ncbi:hypothetical protein JTB14_009666 [Gonioctena quinquepunctata]|nr:hypothetical protein JTB14_009666 [Gonioctena quinquepunctata]
MPGINDSFLDEIINGDQNEHTVSDVEDTLINEVENSEETVNGTNYTNDNVQLKKDIENFEIVESQMLVRFCKKNMSIITTGNLPFCRRTDNTIQGADKKQPQKVRRQNLRFGWQERLDIQLYNGSRFNNTSEYCLHKIWISSCCSDATYTCNLFQYLYSKYIYAVGTIRANRSANPRVPSDKEMKKNGRGSSATSISKDGSFQLRRDVEDGTKQQRNISRWIGLRQ